MNITVTLVIKPRAIPFETAIEKGTTVEELLHGYQEELPYDVLLANVNNRFVELTYSLEKDCRVEFVDMRSQAGNLVYQRSVSMIYIKAIKDVLGKEVNAVIENSLSKGLFTQIKSKEPVTDKELVDIENRMHEIVCEDVKFEKKEPYYFLDGMKDFFCGLMVPSTGYIKHFEIVRYRRGVILRFPHPKNPDIIPQFVDEFKLYTAFAEIKSWGRLMKISFVADMNKMVDNGQYKEIIQISEALHEKKIGQIADMISKGKKRMVLIAGPSSSGKTTFAKRLSVQLRVNGAEPVYLSTDDYFVERKSTPLDENGEPNFEDIECIDIDLFNKNMNDLLCNKTVDLPTFDFIDGTKNYGSRIVKGTKNQVFIIEGIHGLNKLMTKDVPENEKFKIYISPLTQLNIDEHNRISTTDARMIRRIVRDHHFRGHSAKSTIRDWPKVRAGEDKNIFPYNGEADIFFNSVHIYELNVLRKYAEPLLLCIKEDEPEHADAVRMLNFLKFFKIIEDDSIIVNNSIIREFIGGSIFV